MTDPRRRDLLVGIFVGGRGERLGGVAKGLLRAPGTHLSLLERALQEVRAAVSHADVVLVGDASPYAEFEMVSVDDAPRGIGPLGGLLGLLQEAEQRRAQQVLILACDLPFVDRRLIARLAREAPAAAALVTETRGKRNPLVARYEVESTRQAARRVFDSGKRSLQAVLDALGPGLQLLELSAEEAATLDDWDTPEDVNRHPS